MASLNSFKCGMTRSSKSSTPLQSRAVLVSWMLAEPKHIVPVQARSVASFRSDEEDAHLACERISESPGVAETLECVVGDVVIQDPDFVLVGAQSRRHGEEPPSPRTGPSFNRSNIDAVISHVAKSTGHSGEHFVNGVG